LRETFTALIQCYEADGEPEMDINGDPKPREVGFAVDFK
jgi:hypothetical protein